VARVAGPYHFPLCVPPSSFSQVGDSAGDRIVGQRRGDALRETYGAEFSPLKQPYSERQLRNLMKGLLETQRRFTLCCLADFGIGARICGWGEKMRFAAEWEQLIQNSFALHTIQFMHKVRARRALLAFAQNSAQTISSKELCERQ